MLVFLWFYYRGIEFSGSGNALTNVAFFAQVQTKSILCFFDFREFPSGGVW